MDTFMCETDSDEDDGEDFASDGDIEKKSLKDFQITLALANVKI